MSIFGSDDLARTRNVLYTDPDTVPTTTGTGTGERGPMGPQGATGPQGPQGPQGEPGEGSGILKAVSISNISLLDSVNTNTIIYGVPLGYRFVVQDVTFTLDSVTGTTANTLPTVQLYRGTGTGTTNQLSNSFNFQNLAAVGPPAGFPNPLVPGYWVRTGSSSSTTGRGIAFSGQNINLRITVGFASGGADPYTQIKVTCILSGYELFSI